VGFNSFDGELVSDGLNEAGLAMSELWLPGHSSFPDASEADVKRSLVATEFANWSLGNFATVAELNAALPSIKVLGAETEEHKTIPVHFVFHDPSGDCLVVEFVGGRVDVYDNPLGVLTNAPPFDWHVNNLTQLRQPHGAGRPERGALGDRDYRYRQGHRYARAAG
jgi:choloylglycine hydrolase